MVCSQPTHGSRCNSCNLIPGLLGVLTQKVFGQKWDIRHALAQMFDHSANAQHLHAIERATITHAPGSRSTAVLLAGWLMAQLGWRVEKAGQRSFDFAQPDGPAVHLDLRERDGATIGECTLESKEASFRVAHDASSDFLHTYVRMPDVRLYEHMLPAAKENILDLLDRELMRGGT